ncbi:unnamed protein product [Clavelina lepadiformis]|uniref:Uncharacterized protein n=1 Tax=Clavelina lepadiformis TaxID=159417 RepID=A0ABP0G0L7_CLALP
MAIFLRLANLDLFSERNTRIAAECGRRPQNAPMLGTYQVYNFLIGDVERDWVEGDSSLWRSREDTALVITTPRSSTRSFANDLAPRLSNRRVNRRGSHTCRTRVRSDLGIANGPAAAQLCPSRTRHECIVAF